MSPLSYHAGQLEVQTEANTRPIADRLTHWVGPVERFTLGADLLVLATAARGSALRFTVLSGKAPLVDGIGPLMFGVTLAGAGAPDIDGPAAVGGIAINLAQAQRARLNGTLQRDGSRYLLEAAEAFTNCRKYVAPSMALDGIPHTGPETREPIAFADPWLLNVLAQAETAFLATISPEGRIDVSHRGGPPGFFTADPAECRLGWPEFVGDGMLKSAGNIRANGALSLLLLDLDSGDGVEIVARGTWTTLRREKRARVEGLLQQAEPFPLQGRITCEVLTTTRLRGLMYPRQRVAGREKFTSCSSTDDQAPQ